MSPEILKFLTQLPEAGIIVFTVWMFLKHLATESAASREHSQNLNSTLIQFYKEMHKDHITRAEESNRVVAQLVSATEKNISATSRNTYVLETIAKAIEAVIVANHEFPKKSPPQTQAT